MKKLATVIIPAFNAAQTIGDTLSSVSAQTHRELEILVVDDCSTDGTGAIALDRAREDGRIRLIQTEQNSGVGAARNLGISNASGEYCAFIDADDLWHPQKIDLQMNFMRQRNSVLSGTAYKLLNSAEEVSHATIVPPAKITAWRMNIQNHIALSSAMISTEAAGEERMPVARKRQDYAYWISIIAKHGPAHGLSIPLLLYRVGQASSLSNRKLDLLPAQWAFWRQMQAKGHLQSAVYVALNAAASWRKNYRARRKGFSDTLEHFMNSSLACELETS